MHKIIYEDCIQIIKDNDMGKLRNKSFLITGASGMIGSYVANVLKVLNDDYGMNIKILLNVRDENKLSEELRNDSNVTIIKQDVSEKFNIDGPIDYIVHAASPASPKIMKDYPFETNVANTVGTYNTLILAKEKNVSSYLFVSSREIYGEPMDGVEVFTEDGLLGQVNPLVPRNGYAEGKKAAENMCVGIKEEYGINTKILRLAHTYGPGMSTSDGRVQADFLNNVINNQDIIMKSDGSSVRTYTYISDAVNGLFKVLLSSNDIVYNISDDKEVSIKDLANVLVSLSENSKLVMDIDNTLSKGSASFKKGILSNEKIKKELNWYPKYDIKEGFKRTIEYLKDVK
jgi:nucleoside-diphosphate-sugar epimerase